MTSEDKRARVDAVIRWLESEFPVRSVSSREFASTLTPVFRVAQDYVETQLEVSRPVFEEAPETLTALLAKHRIPTTMKANPGKRVVVWREQEMIQVNVESVRELS